MSLPQLNIFSDNNQTTYNFAQTIPISIISTPSTKSNDSLKNLLPYNITLPIEFTTTTTIARNLESIYFKSTPFLTNNNNNVEGSETLQQTQNI